jgi:hypothetical protein
MMVEHHEKKTLGRLASVHEVMSDGLSWSLKNLARVSMPSLFRRRMVYVQLLDLVLMSARSWLETIFLIAEEGL